MLKISNFDFCPILMKLGNNDAVAILKQNVNILVQDFDWFVSYGRLSVRKLLFPVLCNFDKPRLSALNFSLQESGHILE